MGDVEVPVLAGMESQYEIPPSWIVNANPVPLAVLRVRGIAPDLNWFGRCPAPERSDWYRGQCLVGSLTGAVAS